MQKRLVGFRLSEASNGITDKTTKTRIHPKVAFDHRLIRKHIKAGGGQ
jgi:hypothetical protein